MVAPVGVLEEEAGDAELFFAPHPMHSIPARAAHGNCSMKIDEWRVDRRGVGTLRCGRYVSGWEHPTKSTAKSGFATGGWRLASGFTF
jgi:hypothetical protein